ncbi:MAG: sugar ABC transporter permease, partial [Bacillota bacterium]
MVQDAHAAVPRRKSRLQRKNTLIAYSFLAPNFLGFLIITMAPILFTVVLSCLTWNGGVLENMSWAGFGNFQEIFAKFDFKRSDLAITLKNTVLYALATVP